MSKKLLYILICLLLVLACFLAFRPYLKDKSEVNDHEIVVLFTTDIHGEVDGKIDAGNIAFYKKYMLSKTPYVVLVDSGDSFQGSFLGSVSKGDIIAEFMNRVGYDFTIFGNHDFDFGTEKTHELTEKINAQYLNCNITYSGSGVSGVEHSVPYKIVQYGNRSVAFIGVTTPETITSSTPTIYKENGNFVYDFCAGNDGKDLFSLVQKYVDEVRNQGADYVVVLAHLGDDEGAEYSSSLLVKNTTGIDAVLDGHSHLQFTRVIGNKNGDPVYVGQAGTKLGCIGQLVISANGFVTISIIDKITEEDINSTKSIEEMKLSYENKYNKPILTNMKEFPIVDENGLRAVRNQETRLGNLVSDAWRVMLDADIGFIQGGSLREKLVSGEVKYSDVINILPFGNYISSVEITGQELLDMLEYFCRNIVIQASNPEEGKPAWEDPNFPSVSGITFTVDTSVPADIETDENDMLISVGNGPRRVSDVKVLQDGQYVPLDPQKTYTFAAQDYTVKNGGVGMEHFLKDHKYVVNGTEEEYVILAEYMKDKLNGDLSGYDTLDRRITIK